MVSANIWQWQGMRTIYFKLARLWAKCEPFFWKKHFHAGDGHMAHCPNTPLSRHKRGMWQSFEVAWVPITLLECHFLRPTVVSRYAVTGQWGGLCSVNSIWFTVVLYCTFHLGLHSREETAGNANEVGGRGGGQWETASVLIPLKPRRSFVPWHEPTQRLCIIPH